MKILTLDTAMSACSAGVYDTKTGTLSSSLLPMVRGHAEKLVPLIQSVLIESGLDFSDLGLVAVTTGPGAFTGLRIGMSTAEALALSLNIPVAGVTTLSALAAAYFQSPKSGKALLVIIETKRSDFYGQMFSPDGEELSPPFAMSAEAIAESYLQDSVDLIGDANQRFMKELPDQYCHKVVAIEGYEVCSPGCIAKIAAALFDSGALPERIEPVYLRGADVSQSKKIYRVIAD